MAHCQTWIGCAKTEPGKPGQENAFRGGVQWHSLLQESITTYELDFVID